MPKATRSQLQNAARIAKAQAARMREIADKGGEGIWDAETARRQARICTEAADEYTRRLANS